MNQMGVESFFKMEGGYHLQLTAAMVVFLFALPWMSNVLLSKSRRAPARTQKRIWVVQEILLATSVILTFVATAASVLASAWIISPWVWDMPFRSADLDSPLTPRLMFFWLSVAFLGWAVFRWAGLNAVRDVHRSAKESMDLVSRHRSKSGKSIRSGAPLGSGGEELEKQS